MTAAPHTTRARMSLRPRKRVSGAPDRSELLVAWLATNASLRGVLMVALFKLRIRRYKVRKERTTLPERCPPFWLSSHYHNTFPPKNIRGQCFDRHLEIREGGDKLEEKFSVFKEEEEDGM